MNKINSTMGILEYLLFINYEAKSNHNVNYSLTNLIMQNMFVCLFFSSPNVLIIACVDTTWIIPFGICVLWGAHVKLSCFSPRAEIVISLYCIQDNPSSVQEICIFWLKNISFLRMFYLVYVSTNKNNRISKYYYPSSESLNIFWIILRVLKSRPNKWHSRICFPSFRVFFISLYFWTGAAVWRTVRCFFVLDLFYI